MVYLDWYCEGCYIISKTCWGAMAAHSCTLISHSAVQCRRRVHRLMGGWAMYLDGQSLAGHRWATHRERTAGPSSSCPSDRPWEVIYSLLFLFQTFLHFVLSLMCFARTETHCRPILPFCGRPHILLTSLISLVNVLYSTFSTLSYHGHSTKVKKT